MERRRYSRRPANIVVGIDTDTRTGRAGVTCDVSPEGMAFRSPSRFAVGEKVRLHFRDPVSSYYMVEVNGTVVRSQLDLANPVMRNVSGVRFNGRVTALA